MVVEKQVLTPLRKEEEQPGVRSGRSSNRDSSNCGCYGHAKFEAEGDEGSACLGCCHENKRKLLSDLIQYKKKPCNIADRHQRDQGNTRF